LTIPGKWCGPLRNCWPPSGGGVAPDAAARRYRELVRDWERSGQTADG
jgi:hypothetical protein